MTGVSADTVTPTGGPKFAANGVDVREGENKMSSGDNTCPPLGPTTDVDGWLTFNTIIGWNISFEIAILVVIKNILSVSL